MTDADSRSRFISAGVDPRSWPKSEIKNMVLEFESVMREHDYGAAYFKFHGKTSQLSEFEIESDAILFRKTYEAELATVRAKELSRAIGQNPGDCEKLIREFQASSAPSDESYSLREILTRTVHEIERRHIENEFVVRITDYPLLCNMVGGLNPSRIGMIAAKTGVGKTSLGLNLALSAAKTMHVLYVNMEMSLEDIGIKVFQCVGEITYKDIQAMTIPFGKIADMENSMDEKHGVTCTSGRALSLDQIVALTRKTASEKSLKLVIVDYDQKILAADDMDEWKTILRSVTQLEEIAKQEKIHIIVMSQANDDGNPRASVRSMQPMSYVLNFYAEGNAHFLRTIKNRFGPLGELEVSFDKERNLIKEKEIHKNRKTNVQTEKNKYGVYPQA